MKTFNKTIVVLGLLAASIVLHAQDSTAPQSWTASDGRVIQAKFIKLDGESVVIEKDDKQFAVAFARLNADSVALAKKLGGVSSPSAVATPTAANASANAPVNPKATKKSEFVISDSPELRKNGAFGFPQASAKVLRDEEVVRVSAWSNAEWLFVQAVVWADGDDSLAVLFNGKKEGDQSKLQLDLDADQQPTAQMDRDYSVDPWPERRGLHYSIVLGPTSSTVLKDDSKGRGSVQYVPAADGRKIRVDSFIIPLAELGKKLGDKIRLVLTGESSKPPFPFNSAGVRVGVVGSNGKMQYSHHMPLSAFHDFTLGEQTGTIDSSLVPDDRK